MGRCLVSLQPWQPGQPGRPWQAGNPAGMRASHADRERAVDVLKAAYAEGRLNPQEYEQRIGLAYQAHTYGELGRLIADLPQGPVPGPAAAPPVPLTFLPQQPTTNGMAVAAMVCGVLELVTFGVTALPAVVLGHAAKSQIKRNGEEGDGMATAGLVLGYLGIGFWAVTAVLMTLLAVLAGGH